MPQGAWPHDNRRFNLAHEHASRHDLPHHCIGVSQHDHGSFPSIRYPHLRSGRHPPRGVLVLLVDVQHNQAWNQGEDDCRRIQTSSPGITFPGVLIPPSTLPSPVPCRSDPTHPKSLIPYVPPQVASSVSAHFVYPCYHQHLSLSAPGPTIRLPFPVSAPLIHRTIRHLLTHVI